MTNRWKMFDQYVNTTTLSSGNDLVVTLNAGACDTIGLFNVYGSSIVIEQKDADGNIVYTNTVNLSDKTIISDWYAYFINGFEYKSDVLIPIYIYNICTVKITISQRGATASCGIFVMGRSQDVGLAEYDATISMVDYSRISTDTWGRTSLAQGPYAKKADVKFNLINSRIDAVYKQLCKCRGIPIIWDLNNEKADDPFESLLIYGYYNDMSIVIPDPVLSYCSIQIRGLI